MLALLIPNTTVDHPITHTGTNCSILSYQYDELKKKTKTTTQNPNVLCFHIQGYQFCSYMYIHEYLLTHLFCIDTDEWVPVMACSLSLSRFPQLHLVGSVVGVWVCPPSPSLQFSHQAWQEPSASTYTFTNVHHDQSSLVSLSITLPPHTKWGFTCSRLPEAYHATNCRWSGWIFDHVYLDIDLSLVNSLMVIVGLHIHLAGVTS